MSMVRMPHLFHPCLMTSVILSLCDCFMDFDWPLRYYSGVSSTIDHTEVNISFTHTVLFSSTEELSIDSKYIFFTVRPVSTSFLLIQTILGYCLWMSEHCSAVANVFWVCCYVVARHFGPRTSILLPVLSPTIWKSSSITTTQFFFCQ